MRAFLGMTMQSKALFYLLRARYSSTVHEAHCACHAYAPPRVFLAMLCLLLISLGVFAEDEVRVFRVNAASSESKPDGATWATAYTGIQAAIDAASTVGGGEVWVAAGTYTATTDPVVTMAQNVYLYGGFAGTESSREERNWIQHKTTIDGEKKRCCVYGANNATLDGFTVTRGKSLYGAGMQNSSSSPMVTNCTFSGNTASEEGGGIYDTNNSSPTVTNCIFFSNSADSGGGMYNDRSSARVINCTFFQNSASVYGGGGINNFYSSSLVINCILWENSKSDISGDVSAVSYCCFKGNNSGQGNINSLPLFWNGLNGDFRLYSSSPCLNSGTPTDAPTMDIRGVTRPQGAGIDMGAYEMNDPDTDGDGLMDEFETQYTGTDPNDADSNDDGISDGDAWFDFHVWYVNAATTTKAPDGLSWATAFPNIQAAIDCANNHGGGEIWVAKGTYRGTGNNVVLMRDNIHLYGGFAGIESSREERNWIQNKTTIDGEKIRCCVYGANNATLDGFTVTSGESPSGDGGGMYNNYASPTIANCTFSHNSVSYRYGGGIYNKSSSPTITCCVFSKNSSYYGGGISNYGNPSPTITNCVFSHNHSRYGGGIYNNYSSPTVTNCTFSGNTANQGGGMYDESSSSKVTNSILWGNTPDDIINTSSLVSYCCIQYGSPGAGNIAANPLFWNPKSDDFRLHPSSACLNRGTMTNAPAMDIRSVLRPHDTGIDIGAYEMNEPDTDADGLMDAFEALYSATNPNDADSDNDGINDGDALIGFRTLYVDAATQAKSPDGLSWATAFSRIQPAIDCAYNRGGGEIWVAQGTYAGTDVNVVSMRYNVHIFGGFTGTESTREERNWAQHKTVIDGEDMRQCVIGANNATLDGFLVINGKGKYEGCGGMYNSSSSPYVTNCTFSGNNTNGNGGGIYNSYSSPTVTNCTFSGNNANGNGGGMYNAYSSPNVMNCTFSGNNANEGGGIYNSFSSPTIVNCIFTHNTSGYGGGMYTINSSPVVAFCTFSQNSASRAGGIFCQSLPVPVITNCIVWDNPGMEISGNAPIVTYSCIKGGFTGEGNIDANPQFWNLLEGDMRLHLSSPCLDAGISSSAAIMDIRGMSRSYGAGVDMGAYEMNGPDTDGDGLMDEFEILYAGTDPNDVDSNNDGINDGNAWFSTVVYHVNAASKAESPDGLSWSTAFPDIQSAVDRVYTRGGGEIWVAHGTYTSTNDNVVMMRLDVHLYGGFAGVESSREARNVSQYKTVIDGENGRRCVLGADNATLDGFFITRGKQARGGGLYAANSSPTIANCVFTANSAEYGGGIYIEASTPSILNCIFTSNTASSWGGGLFVNVSMTTLTNCTIAKNSARNNGGGIYNADSALTLVNCILWNNTGGEISGLITGEPPLVSYSCIDGGYLGEGNIDQAPQFWTETDFKLHPSSPCIDSGTSKNAPGTDFRGVARPHGAGVDMGAYEMNEPDTDGDGLMDDFETLYAGTDPNNEDSDGDGVRDDNGWIGNRVWYVNAASTAQSPDGFSWATAFPDIQSAIARAHDRRCGEIWVAQGVYTGTGENVVRMQDNQQLYGGFAGSELSRKERDWTQHATIIDGENARRGVLGANNATLDGFTITRGNSLYGGGMCNNYAAPIVTNCKFISNKAGNGGGMYNNSDSSPLVSRCLFTSNTAGEGGGINNYYSSPIVNNCLFSTNHAERGGGFYNYYSSPAVLSCLFTGNTSISGSGISNDSSYPFVKNCTFTKNEASDSGGVLYNMSSCLTISNCVLWNNANGNIIDHHSTLVITYSCVQGGYEGEGNIDADPLFVDPDDGDYRLRTDSPCIDAGNDVLAPPVDMDGVVRPQGTHCDMGAYEYFTPQEPECPLESLYGALPAGDQPEFNGVWSDYVASAAVYDNIMGPASILTDLRWWGSVAIPKSDSLFSPDQRAYNVHFYTDDAGKPGQLLADYPVYPRKTFTGHSMQLLNQTQWVYRYDIALPEPVSVPAGTHWVSVMGEGEGPQAFFWARSDSGDGQYAETLLGSHWEALSTSLQAGDLALCEVGVVDTSAPGTLRGAISNLGTGQPIECATVIAENETRTFIAGPGADGAYTLSIPEGMYTVTVYAPGMAPATASLDLGGGELVTQDFALSPCPVSIDGLALSAETSLSIASARVDAVVNGEVVATTYTCGSGAFTFPAELGLSGEVTLRVSGNGLETTENVLTIIPGETMQPILHISVEPDFFITLSGLVTCATNARPIEGATVSVYHPDTNSLLGSAVTKTDGSYIVEGLNPYLTCVLVKCKHREFAFTETIITAPLSTLNMALNPIAPGRTAKPSIYPGASAFYLNWPVNPECNLRGSQIWRREAIPGDSYPTAWTYGAPEKRPRRLIQATEYTDLFTDAERGHYFQYQIIPVNQWDASPDLSDAVDPNDSTLSLYWSDPVQAGTLTLSPPADEVVSLDGPNPWLLDQDTNPDPDFPYTDGQWVRIPIQISSAYGVSAAGMTLTAQVAADMLYAAPGDRIVARTTDLTTAMTASAEIASDSIATITATGPEGAMLYGRGALFDLFFQVRTPAICTDELNLRLLTPAEYPDQGTLLYDANGALIPLDLPEGRLCFETGADCQYGDVNEDGLIDLDDAGRLVDLAIHPDQITPCAQWAGDLYPDTYINAQDATRLGNWITGEPETPVKAIPVSIAATANAGEQVLVRMGQIHASEGQTEVDVPLLIETPSGILPLWGFEADIAYPVAQPGTGRNDGLTFIRLTLNGAPLLVDAPATAYSASENSRTGYGQLRIAAAGVPVETSKAAMPLLTATFRLGADFDLTQPIPATLKRFTYHDAYGYAPQHGAPGAPVIIGQVPGDANNDGVADNQDAITILQAAVGLCTLDTKLYPNADVTGDGKLDYKDAAWILQAAVGLRTL